jgi:hypothetical protein
MINKAQGAIEYLLIIGAAILVVAVVILAIVSITSEVPQNKDIVYESLDGLALIQFERSTGLNALEQLMLNEPGVNNQLETLYNLNDNSLAFGNSIRENTAILNEENGLWDTNTYFFDSSNNPETYIEIRKDRINPVTYSMWVKPNIQKTNESHVFNGLSHGDEIGLDPNNPIHWRQKIILQPNLRVRYWANTFGCIHGNDSYSLYSNNSIELNEWANIVWTSNFDEDDNWHLELYINGVLNETISKPKKSSTYTGICNDQIPIVWLGRRKGEIEVSKNFDGYIEDFAVWNRVLSEEEIENFYIKGSGEKQIIE